MTFPMLRGAGAGPADDGHHVERERDADARKATLGECGAADDSAVLLLHPALPILGRSGGGGGAGRGLMASRGIGCGARGTSSLREVVPRTVV
jgi:hypothetical protein